MYHVVRNKCTRSTLKFYVDVAFNVLLSMVPCAKMTRLAEKACYITQGTKLEFDVKTTTYICVSCHVKKQTTAEMILILSIILFDKK